MWRNPKYADPSATTAPPQENGRRLATFPRNRGDEELRVTLAEFNGHSYISLRVWSRGEDGSFWPVAGKGCSVRIREVAALAEALERVGATVADTHSADARQGPAR